ncbi:flagellar hook assembly protein FlgD [Sutcliffiella halmapala]|uniref:flagellar hook assembly protein FlgD n=1 Tax=Sutcliffiella halmapala TaxID=79882 RepID=UPI0009959104|nr:flagellar hook assembly protein FlgD [Sutcliffiella halmapala]
MTNISSDLYIQNRPVESTKQNNVLGKDDFLRLLMAQLQNQDPMNPMEDREFIAQMATFSSLEQMTNLNNNMESFLNAQNKMNVLYLQQYLGTEISWQDVTYIEDEPFVEVKNGVVTSISMADGKARLVMDDGSEIAVEQITKVSHSDNMTGYPNSSLLQASHLIGKKVSLLLDEITYNNVRVDSVLSKNGKTYFTVTADNLAEKKIPLDAITKISE